MSELSPEARQLLQAARSALSPEPEELRAGRAALLAKLAEPGAVDHADAGVGAESSRAPLRALAGPGSSTAWLTGSVLMTGVLAALYMTLRPRAVPEVPAATPSSAAAQRSPEPSLPSARPAPPSPQPSAAVVPVAKHPKSLKSASTRRPHASRAASALAADGGNVPGAASVVAPVAAEPPSQERALAAPASRDELAREVALIRSAHAAVERGDQQGALEILNGYEQRFPHGVLGDEQLAIRTRALCKLGRFEEARVSLRRLAALAPTSPHLRQLENACHSPP
jgi:hypothetical protein